MKEITYEQENQKLGRISGVLRINGKILYFKSKGDNQYQGQILTQLQARGAHIERSTSGWIKVDMFKNLPDTFVKLAGVEFDTIKNSPEEIENILYDFYAMQFVKAGFKIK